MAEEFADIKIVALMSVPLCGWNPHYGLAGEALKSFGIPLRLAFGAYWHQGMSNLFEDCRDEGIDWILTLDYDSLFVAEHLDRLLGVFGARSDIDALAALQCKRGGDEVPLLTTGTTEVEITGDPIRVKTAHFGMTLLRVDALKRVPMPWFKSVPGEGGSYRNLDRVDADIFFWHEWERAANTAYVDPRCVIGHLQAMVADFDENYKVRHRHWPAWRKAQRGVV